jgi:hypothetical protein
MGRGNRKPSNYISKIQQTQGRTVRDFTESLVSSGTDTPLLPGVTLQKKRWRWHVSLSEEIVHFPSGASQDGAVP